MTREQKIQALCKCNNESDRLCSDCEILLCDDCDAGTWQDQCSYCVECKLSRAETVNEELINECNRIEGELAFIRRNYRNAKGLQPSERRRLNQYTALAASIHWQVSLATSPIVEMTDRRYRSIRSMVENDVDYVMKLIRTTT